MKRKNTISVGTLHPILFFAGVYLVTLIFSIFICSSIFYSCNSSTSNLKSEHKKEIKLTELEPVEMATISNR